MILTNWNWGAFKGSEVGLKLCRRELAHLDAVVAQLSRRRVAVQAGGNLGIFPKRLAEAFETVYTFEPSAELFPLLIANAPEPNIVRFQAALGYDRALVATIRARRGLKTGFAHEGVTHIAGPGVVPVLRIDDLALPVCDLIYLDIEGHEAFALQGAAATLGRCRPAVAVEINENITHEGLTRRDVVTVLEAHGYHFVQKLGSDEFFLPEAA